MFSSFDSLVIHSSLSVYSGCQLSCSPPEEDASSVLKFGNFLNSFEIYVHDQGLRRLLTLAELALGKMDASRQGKSDVPAEAGEVEGRGHPMKHLSWMCLEDDHEIDFVIQGPERMFFRIRGGENTFELGFDVEPLRRLVKIGHEIIAILDRVPGEAEDEAA